MGTKYLDETGTVYKSLKVARKKLERTHITKVFETAEDLRRFPYTKNSLRRDMEGMEGRWISIR